jgi:hypothetical protein
MRRPKWVYCRMASHSTYGWKNFGDTYAFRGRKLQFSPGRAGFEDNPDSLFLLPLTIEKDLCIIHHASSA